MGFWYVLKEYAKIKLPLSVVLIFVTSKIHDVLVSDCPEGVACSGGSFGFPIPFFYHTDIITTTSTIIGGVAFVIGFFLNLVIWFCLFAALSYLVGKLKAK